LFLNQARSQILVIPNHCSSIRIGESGISDPRYTKLSRRAFLKTLDALSVIGLTKRFGGLEALADVNVTVRPGELLGIIGPNGSGKTTLFDVVSGFLRPTRGRIEYKGRNLAVMTPSQISRLGLSRTFQLVRAFRSLTVLENIMTGYLGKNQSVRAARGRAIEIAESTGLARFAEYEAAHLSTGLQKRLEIARALATEPELLLLDEAMAGLSSEEYGETVNLIRSVNKTGTTVVMVEHIMDVIVGLCERVVVLSTGRKIADGKTEDVLNDPTVIGVYLGEGGSE
jgi:branched-chain amino acid transport system ATP-binding protein